MGEIVAAAIFGHQPAIMAPEPMRMAMGRGRDTTLVSSIPEFRRRLDGAAADTFVIIDTHWFTTGCIIRLGCLPRARRWPRITRSRACRRGRSRS